MTRVLVGMSGGVDSSVAALLLAEAGREVMGVTLLLSPTSRPDDADARSAARVCGALGVPHRVLDCRGDFEDLVVGPFVRAYARGLTPSPCVACNRRAKLAQLLAAADDLGCPLVATGHYARVRVRDDGRAVVSRAACAAKDQSYFLCQASQRELRRLVLPLGDLSKEEVRALAAERGLPCAGRRESQDICFVPDGDHAAFVGSRAPGALDPGPVLDADGRELGRHAGLACHTVGQRRGLGLPGGPRRYVLAKDAARNALVVGSDGDLVSDGVEAREAAWGARLPEGGAFDATLVVCSRGTPHAARVVPTGRYSFRAEVPGGVRAPAPGQYAVAYVGEEVACSGVISG